MKSTIAVIVILLLSPLTGSAAASTQDGTSAAVAPAAGATTEASGRAAVVALRQRPLSQTAGLVALFGALAGVGFFVARPGRRESETS